MLKLQSIQDFHDVSDASELAGLLERLIAPDGTGAFWLHRDGECELALFLNGRRAAVYRSTDGSWSSTPHASDDDCEQFRLENGQIDDFPLSQCVPTADGIAAFLATARTGQLSGNIAWD
ncbi:hypothetical protein Poly51_39640 [Rubripirellula tenax]|uniref:Immunity protein Imm1 n=1 Tax=Rubripirellula tenax TaxID=2528015 RepID=A0A5C6ETL7_9BACT|nr:Imm1 family immunity protein [Rubripirellula tenax]TWU50671.1 hypothetical protein Poly51_39640 [Rubripirellula tenax]